MNNLNAVSKLVQSIRYSNPCVRACVRSAIPCGRLEAGEMVVHDNDRFFVFDLGSDRCALGGIIVESRGLASGMFLLRRLIRTLSCYFRVLSLISGSRSSGRAVMVVVGAWRMACSCASNIWAILESLLPDFVGAGVEVDGSLSMAVYQREEIL